MDTPREYAATVFAATPGPPGMSVLDVLSNLPPGTEVTHMRADQDVATGSTEFEVCGKTPAGSEWMPRIFSSAAVVEYAVRNPGTMTVHRDNQPWQSNADTWVRSNQRFGPVYRRRVIVVEDWTEVTDEQ